MQTTAGKGYLMKNKILGYSIFLSVIICMTFLSGCATSLQNRERASTHVNMGTAYLKSGHFSPALREFLEAQSFSPSDPEIRYYTGLSYYGSGMKEEAKREFKKALSDRKSVV